MNSPDGPPLTLEVLQQFRLIYGSMRQYFREVEERCGMSGSQMWILQEVQRAPGIGVSELAERMGIHQSTCSQLTEKLVNRGCIIKNRHGTDHRRVGLYLDENGHNAIASLPGPAEGILPEALALISPAALKTLHIHLSELIRHLPGRVENFANTPLADMLQSGNNH